MRTILITGARCTKDIILNQDSTTGVITLAIDQPIKVDGKYDKKTLWISAYLKGDILERAQKMKIAKGSCLNLVGDFDVSGYEKDKKYYANVSMNVKQVEFAQAAGNGLCKLMISGARFGKDPEVKDDYSTVSAAFDIGFGDKKETQWFKIYFGKHIYQTVQNMKLKKGSSVDIIGNFDVSTSEDNGKFYLNLNVMADSISYSALRKPDENKAQANENQLTDPDPNPNPNPTNNQAQASNTVPVPNGNNEIPETNIDDFGFSGEPTEDAFF